MIIAIDFDKTWTADPEMWSLFVELAEGRGHRCIIATGRTQSSPDMGRFKLYNMPIIYCGREYKERACQNAGWKVDIWIDDMPSMIQECLIINANDEL